MSGVGVGSGEGVRVAVGTADGVCDGIGGVVGVEGTSKVFVATGAGTEVSVASPTGGAWLAASAVIVVVALSLSVIAQPPKSKAIVSRQTSAFIFILRAELDQRSRHT
jgi:hypothetical protein